MAANSDAQALKEFGPELRMSVNRHTTPLPPGAGHMQLFGTKKEQLGAIAIAFRNHAQKNPNAFLRDPLTIEQYMKAKLIVDPLGLYDCSVYVDAAGAVVVTSAERAET